MELNRSLEIEHTCSEICKVIWSVIGFLLVGSRVLSRGAFSCRQHTVLSGSMPVAGRGR